MTLRMIAFARVASSPDGTPIYSIMDIIEPLPRYNYSLLRNARLTANVDGHVLVGRADADMDTYRKVPGIYCRSARQLAADRAAAIEAHDLDEYRRDQEDHNPCMETE